MVNAKLTYFNIKVRLLLALIGLTSFIQSNYAQNVTVSAEMDSTMIFIGGQIDLRLQMSQPADLEIAFPLLTDTIIKEIEIVKAGKLDTLSRENQRLLIQQTFTITSFDSGLHYIPPIVFEEASNKLSQQIETNHLSLMVVNPFEEVDPQKGITDIKMPLNTPFHLSELLKYWPWILGMFVLAGIITLVIMKLTGKKMPVNIFKKEEPQLPPHEIALKELDKIKEEKLWQRNLVKAYYSRVTDTLRHYIEERYEINAMEQTSDEIMSSFKGREDIDNKSLDNLRTILNTADLVKFAKHEPLPDENDLNMINAYFFINQTKQEEIKTLEEEKEALMKKEEETEAVTNK
ncbi:hypothetical protein [Carboxylicivirga caseinilyticus]|uniref:hypothetical protein n=1 Tax=Carboxylicivirga caseinilyticus TaxID=3417572 RepID=UPI003D325F30|nr:hypothetical protein [Marinilabiliaceae bacterium A049]